MQHSMNLHDAPFCKIKEGLKTVEMRLFDQRRKSIKVGDTILFTNNSTGEQMVVSVTSVEVFETFQQLYNCYDKVAIGYMPSEVANPDDMLLYYTKEQIALHGVVAIGIKVQ